MTLLTKSKYIHGLTCPRFLWMEVHEKDKLPEVDKVTQHRFDQGYVVGEMAKECFPQGIDLAGLADWTTLTAEEGKEDERKRQLTKEKLAQR